MSLKLVTFKTTQTILGNYSVDGNEVTIKEPVQVIVQPGKDGPMLGFAPFLQFAKEFEDGIKFNLSDILCVTTPVVELENQYNTVFGSGIQIASAFPKV